MFLLLILTIHAANVKNSIFKKQIKGARIVWSVSALKYQIFDKFENQVVYTVTFSYR